MSVSVLHLHDPAPSDLVRRVRGEYLEMPGVRLTGPQARCLFGLDAETWEAVLTQLLNERFLVLARGGTFAIAEGQR